MSSAHILDGHILNLVHTHEITEQSELQRMLHERDYVIPQATLSRRLKKLQIAKVSGVYRIIGANLPHLPQVLNVQVSDFGMIVLHTHPGNANSLAHYFDRKYVTFSQDNSSALGILGTLAGDDTILVIVKSQAQVNDVLQMIKEEFPYLKM